MADQIRVNFNSLATAVDDIAAGVSNAGARLDDLKAAIAPMVATWEGDAQAAYQVQQTKWDTAWSDLTSALVQFQNATATSNSGYQAGEVANTSAWS